MSLLVDALSRHTPSAPVLLRTGTVTAITSGHITVTLAGTAIPTVPRLASYAAPVVGDVVQVLQANSQLLVLGPVVV